MSSKQSSPNRRPHYAILERDRKQRRTDRNIRLMRDTAPLARTGKSKSKKTQSLSLAESLTRATVEEMLATRRTAQNNNNYHVPRPTSKIIKFRVQDDEKNPYWDERQEQRQQRQRRNDEYNDYRSSSNQDTSTTQSKSKISAKRCEVRVLPQKTSSLGCLLLRVDGIATAADLLTLIKRASTLSQPGVLGLLIDCRLDHIPSTIAYDDTEGLLFNRSSHSASNARTPSKPTSHHTIHTSAVGISICSSMEDVRKLYHGYRKHRQGDPKVRIIVCGQVLTFHAVEVMQYGEAKARGVTIPFTLPVGLEASSFSSFSSSSSSNTHGNHTHNSTNNPGTGTATLGTAFYRSSKDHNQTDDDDDGNNENSNIHIAWGENNDGQLQHGKTGTHLKMKDVLSDERDYEHLSPIERALRILGDDVVFVKQEFDSRSMNGSTITQEQARRAISSLMNGVVPNVASIIDDYLKEEYNGIEDVTFSELLIIYSNKFYFLTLQRRHETMRQDVQDLKSQTKTIVSVKQEDVEEEYNEEYDDDEEWETVIASEIDRERLETARSRSGGQVSEVEILMRNSLQEEEKSFAQRVNAAFRRFDVYGVDLDAIGKGENAYDVDDDEFGTDTEQGFIMIDDAPDALIAVGLPIEREEAESLVADLSSGASSDFRGFTLTEFRMVCARVLSVFEDDDGIDGGASTSRSSKK